MLKIIRALTLAVVFIAATFSVCGCQDGKNIPPVIPENPSQELTITSQQETSNFESGHYLWGYYLVKIDPDSLESEIIPIREIMNHMNVLKFLEKGPCTNCFKIAGISPGPSGTLNIDISIKHPYATPLLTGFDVRGIAIFNGSKIFPVSGLTMSDSTLGDGELINADGYTTLYNPSTIDHGPFEGYLKGKFATATAPNATLNGYKRFDLNDPATRNAFYAGDEVTATFWVKMPKPFVFGYAVDANWAPAINKPVTDPMTDFGPEANCPEAWLMVINDMGPGLTSQGGTTTLQIVLGDWQGKDDTHPVIVECPDLFDGEVQATWKEDFPAPAFTASIYEAVIGNTKLAADGMYHCLVSKEANENNPSVKPWMDISAYQIYSVHVGEKLNPVEINHVDTFGQVMEVAVSGGYAYVADCTSGLTIIDIDPPESAYTVKSVDTTDARGVAVSGGYAYVADKDSGLTIIDIDPPESAFIVKSVATPSFAYGAAVSGGYAYVAAYDESSESGLLIIIDIEPLGSAYIVSCVNMPDWAMEVAVSGGYAYVADWNPGLQIIDIEPPESAFIVKSVDMPGGAVGVAVSGSYAYVVSDGMNELQIIDIEPPESACIVKYVGTPGNVRGVAVSGDYAYIADGSSGFRMIDIEPLESAYVIGSVDMPGEAMGVAVSGSYAYVADWADAVDDSLRIIQLW